MKKPLSILVFLFFLVTNSVFANGVVFNVKDFGAKGDGKTLDHIAINKAIDPVAGIHTQLMLLGVRLGDG